MLGNQVILPCEDRIPAFNDCLNPETVLDACRQNLENVDRESRDAWQQAIMVEALYHPGKYLRVAYALAPKTGVSRNRYWPEADMVYLHAPLRYPMSRRGIQLDLNNADVELYRFPHDRRLRGLRKFAGRASALSVWQNWREKSHDTARLSERSLQRLLVRYVPEQKWVVRLRAESEDSQREKVRIGVRCGRPSAIMRLKYRHEILAKQASGASFAVPEVIGVSEDRCMLGTSWVRGNALSDNLTSADIRDTLSQIAARLGRFHQSEVAALSTVDTAELIKRAQQCSDFLGSALPPLGNDASSAANELTARLSELGSVPFATIHNDFHFGQVTVKRDRYAIFDFERLARGDPLIDVAAFATQLDLLAHRDEFEVDSTTATACKEHFLEAWKESQGLARFPASFACYSALTALELATGMMRHLRAGWAPLAHSCVQYAGRQMAAIRQQQCEITS